MKFYTISNYSETPSTNNTAIQQNTFVDGKRGTAILLLSRREREARNCLSVFRPLTKDQSRRHWMKCHVTHPPSPLSVKHTKPWHAGGTSSAKQPGSPGLANLARALPCEKLKWAANWVGNWSTSKICMTRARWFA